MDNHVREEVSVVIPTRGRPKLVLRAIEGALAQTYDPIEVVVVVDGPDDETEEALGAVDDARLKVVVLPSRMGPTGVRNAGVDASGGAWIAFLDDDDEMLPGRVEAQMEAARRSPYALPIVTSRCIVRTPKGDSVRPRKLIASLERLDEYLFTRHAFLEGEGAITTSLILIKKDLLKKFPFRSGLWLHSHDDWEWLLRVSAIEGVGFESVPESLVVRYVEEDRPSLSSGAQWRRSLAWIQDNRNFMTPHAYGGAILSVAGRRAARERDWKAFFPLLKEAVRSGKPGVLDLLFYMVRWLASWDARHRFRVILGKMRGKSFSS